jgi:hypothetical protein
MSGNCTQIIFENYVRYKIMTLSSVHTFCKYYGIFIYIYIFDCGNNDQRKHVEYIFMLCTFLWVQNINIRF